MWRLIQINHTRFGKFTCTNIDAAVMKTRKQRFMQAKTSMAQTDELLPVACILDSAKFVFIYRRQLTQNLRPFDEKTLTVARHWTEASALIRLPPQVFVVAATWEGTLIPTLRHWITLSVVAMVSVPFALKLLWISKKTDEPVVGLLWSFTSCPALAL